MDIQVREASPADMDFARALYFETMRGMIEPLFGWDQGRQEESFAGWFDLQQASIIMADGRDVGWMQTRTNEGEVFLGSPCRVTTTPGHLLYPAHITFAASQAS